MVTGFTTPGTAFAASPLQLWTDKVTSVLKDGGYISPEADVAAIRNFLSDSANGLNVLKQPSETPVDAIVRIHGQFYENLPREVMGAVALPAHAYNAIYHEIFRSTPNPNRDVVLNVFLLLNVGAEYMFASDPADRDSLEYISFHRRLSAFAKAFEEKHAAAQDGQTDIEEELAALYLNILSASLYDASENRRDYLELAHETLSGFANEYAEADAIFAAQHNEVSGIQKKMENSPDEEAKRLQQGMAILAAQLKQVSVIEKTIENFPPEEVNRLQPVLTEAKQFLKEKIMSSDRKITLQLRGEWESAIHTIALLAEDLGKKAAMAQDAMKILDVANVDTPSWQLQRAHDRFDTNHLLLQGLQEVLLRILPKLE